MSGAAYAAASTLRTVADCQLADGSMAAAAITLRRVTTILERASDEYTVACARLDEASAQIGAEQLPEAARLLRRALPDLRKRKGGHTRAEEAATLLAALVRPSKRLRRRTHPEDC